MNSKSTFLKRTLAFLIVLCMMIPQTLTVFAEVSFSSDKNGGGLFEDVSGKYGYADRTQGFNSSVQKNKKDKNTAYWIFVHFKGKSISELHKESGTELSLTEYAKTDEAKAAESKMLEEHESFLSKLDKKGISYKSKYSYTLFSDAVAIKVLYKDVNKVSKIKGVKKVTFSEHYSEPEAITENNANVWGTGIYKTEGISYDGEGLVVAVLDTGLDRSHSAFLTMPGSGALKKSDVATRIFDGNTSAGLLRNDRTTTIDEVYYNEKVPFAYDYADKDPVVYPSYSVHGTHVAGIIAGNTGDAANEPIKDSDGNPILGKDGTPLTFRGVAPEAQLVICKVFTDREDSQALGGAETVDILAALEDCVKLGVDVINMSLGSSAGFSEGDDEMKDVYASIRANGISLVVAASNDYSSAYGSNTGTNLTDNPDSATVGSPSTFDEAMSVASISGQKSQYMLANDGKSVIFFNEVSDGNGNKKEFVKELLKKLGKGENETVTLPYVAVQLYGQITGYTGLDVKDKIVLVERGGGGMTFEEKVRIAKMKGALAVIIYNNVSGNINMTIGGVSDIPVCSITMDSSKGLLASIDKKREGTITLSASLLGGPFMSDFSSWGPTPSLNLKPEITAHGGEITSAVPGGWDTLSGTSMAAPNMAGAYTLVLQYIREKFPELDKNAQITLANRLIMSTPVIAYDEYGTPYSPRKQGAGLATIKNAIESQAYLYVDGIDKTKIELGDDKNKTGIYNLKFKLANIGNKTKSYDLSALVMTETVIEDNSGVRTVAEHAYMLNDLCTIEYSVNGSKVTNGKVSVGAGQTVEITAKVTLNADARRYLDENFKNGMYIEGFVCLKDNDSSNGINLSVPFLGFYGDWYSAPMFDLSAFDEAKAEQDDSIPDDEKPKTAVYATIPLGSYYGGRYIIPLGSYLYEIPSYMNKKMYASEDKVSVSMYDTTNHRTAYQLYSIYTGLLRGAKFMDIKITDTVTGEVVYEERQTNIRKAYSGGSTTASASNVLLELSPKELGLANNRKYLFEMNGTMDRVLEQGNFPASRPDDYFSFTFYVDNEAPELVDYRVRFDPYKDVKETKYKVYLDMDIYDNHYAQSVALCYLNNDELELELLTGDWIPIESTRGGVTTVSMDITDYYDSDIDIYIQVDDYALNTHAYHLTNWKTLAEAVVYPEKVEINGTSSVKMDIGDVKTVDIKVTPASSAATNLYWTSSNEKVVKVQNGELYAVGEGKATVTVYAAPNTATATKATVEVEVSNKTSTKQIKLKALKLGLIRNGDGAMTDPTELVDVHPNTTYVLNVSADPWYFPGELDIRFSSSAPDVASVDEKTGVVKTLREGTAYITATQYVNGKASAFAVTAKLNVGPDFVVQNGTLRSYHGLGGKVTIPKSLNVYYIYEKAFKDNNNITELEISSPCMEIQASAFDGMTALKRVILPQSVTFVASDAFRNCTALERIDLRSRAITFSDRCFSGCTSLKYINNLVVTDSSVDTKTANILDLSESQFKRTSPQIGTLGKEAFKGCTALESVDITQLRVSGDTVFKGCTSLKEVTVSSHTVMSELMFENCENLSTIRFTDTDGFAYNDVVLPFSGCSVKTLAFANGGSGNYYLHTDGCYYTDKTLDTLVFAPQTITSYTAPESTKHILAGAFAGNRKLRTLNLTNVESIGAYAFADTGLRYTDRYLTIPASVKEMGEGVFYGASGLTMVDVSANIAELPAKTFEFTALKSVKLSGTITKLGDRSFSYTDFETLDLTGSAVRELGNYVFSYMYKLESISLPALTKIGAFTFYYAPDPTFDGAPDYYPLKSVSLAEGTTVLGDAMFYSLSGFPYLTEIKLPNSVKNNVTVIGDMTFSGCSAVKNLNLGALTKAGDYSFASCKALETLDLNSLTEIGDSAFRNCESLKFSDLSKVTRIGNRALANTSIESANLVSCEYIGERAFSNTKLKTLNGLVKAKTIGAYAFENTALEGTFTLPATIAGERTAIGRGILIGTKVSKIALAGNNPVYYVKDGILFSTLENGSAQLELCPPEYDAKEYTVPAGTVRIQDDAFRSVTRLEKVTMSKEIAAIGDKAFYGCSAKEYVFPGLTAPILETYIANVFANDAQKYIFSESSNADRTSEDAKAEEKYYANFSDYAALVLYPELSKVESLGLKLSYPANAAGFEGRIWKLFFAESEKTSTIAEEDTLKAIEAISKMPEIKDIESVKSMTDKNAAKDILAAYKELVHAARVAYNKVTNVEQKTFITDAQKLFDTEKVIREAREALGETVKITDLRIKQSPNKLVYKAGELFDASGMILTVIYDDFSESEVSEGFVLPTTPLTAGQQTVKFTYQGIEKEISLTVNRADNETVDTGSGNDTDTSEPGSDTESGNTDTDKPGDNGDGSPITGVVIAIIVVVAAAVIAVTVIVLKKKAKDGK